MAMVALTVGVASDATPTAAARVSTQPRIVVDEIGTEPPVVSLSASERVTAISSLGDHTCVLLSTGAVKCWGVNTYGQLGLGDTNHRGDGPGEAASTAVAVDLGSGVTATAIAAGWDHTCALLSSGAVKCWGVNTYGQLGLGDTNSRGDGANEMGDNLSAVDLGSSVTVIAIAAGGFHTCALLSSGAMKCWGYNFTGALGLDDWSNDRGDQPGEMGANLPTVDLGSGVTATAILGGRLHTCALLSSGAMKCWGENWDGQLGLGDRNRRGTLSSQMGDNLPAVNLGSGVTATAIAAGLYHTCALLSSGAMKCWGGNGDGQLGLGDTNSRGDGANEMGDNLPTVDLGSGVTATAIVGGRLHTCALLSTGTVTCWGDDAVAQLGQGAGVTYGNRGDGPGEMGSSLVAVNLGSGVTATAIAAGQYHTCALLSRGAVKCWGENWDGQLGLGDSPDRRGYTPRRMGDGLPLAYGFVQTISFTPSDRLLSYTPFSMSVSSDSGLAVSLVSSTSDVCTASGVQVTMVAAGVCTLTASQVGDSYHLPATSVTRSFTIAKNPQAISFSPSDQLLSYTPFLMASSSNSGLSVSLTSSTSDVCTASGLQVTMVAAGVCTLTASQVGDSYHLPATSVTKSFTIAKNPQKIAFDVPANKVLSTKSFAVAASSDSGLSVTLNSSTSKVCTVWGSLVTMVAAGVCTLTASQVGDSYHLPATSVRSFAVSLPVPVMKQDSQASLVTIAKRAKVTIQRGAKVSGVVSNSSKKYCKMSGPNIVALSPGICRVMLTIDPKGRTKASKRVSVKITG
jgi:alpha-tubulin suppressor-like RCC1 family protein